MHVGCNRETSTKEEVLDIAFMMDASGSLYGDNYSKEKKFVKQVIDNLNIGRGQTRVSVMTYSKNANVYVKFDQYFDKTALKSAVDGIPYEALNTRIDKALALAKTEMFSPANGARPYARRVRHRDHFTWQCLPVSSFKSSLFLYWASILDLPHARQAKPTS